MFVSKNRNKITRCVQCLAQDEQMIPFIHKKRTKLLPLVTSYIKWNPQLFPLLSMEYFKSQYVPLRFTNASCNLKDGNFFTLCNISPFKEKN